MDESRVEPAAHADHIVDAAPVIVNDVPLLFDNTAPVDHTYPVLPPMIEPDFEDYLLDDDSVSVCMEVEESDDDNDEEMIDDVATNNKYAYVETNKVNLWKTRIGMQEKNDDDSSDQSL